MEGGLRTQNRGQRLTRWYRDLKFGELYHPYRAWGWWIIFLCIFVMFILAVTGVVPESLQRVSVFILFTVLIFGAVLFFVGETKTYPRSAYPFIIALFLFAFIMVVIYAILQG